MQKRFVICENSYTRLATLLKIWISYRYEKHGALSNILADHHPSKYRRYIMHPLFHTWAKDRLQVTAQSSAWAITASTLSLSIEANEEYCSFFRRIQSHVESCVGSQPERHFANRNYPPLEICRRLAAEVFSALESATRLPHSQKIGGVSCI